MSHESWRGPQQNREIPQQLHELLNQTDFAQRYRQGSTYVEDVVALAVEKIRPKDRARFLEELEEFYPFVLGSMQWAGQRYADAHDLFEAMLQKEGASTDDVPPDLQGEHERVERLKEEHVMLTRIEEIIRTLTTELGRL